MCDYKESKSDISVGLPVSWAFFALLPGSQKRIEYCVTVFCLSRWRSGLLQRKFFSSMRCIPEERNAQISSSRALQWGFFCHPQKKRNKGVPPTPALHSEAGLAHNPEGRELVSCFFVLFCFVFNSNPKRIWRANLGLGGETEDTCLKWQQLLLITAADPVNKGSHHLPAPRGLGALGGVWPRSWARRHDSALRCEKLSAGLARPGSDRELAACASLLPQLKCRHSQRGT